MRYANTVLAMVLALAMVALVAPAASAHERETFVSWEVANEFIAYLGPPVFTKGTVGGQGPFVPSGEPPVVGQAVGTDPDGNAHYPTINLNVGDVLLATYSFQYKGGDERRGDLFWVTRLGLDFGTLGRYVTEQPGGVRQFIGANSFALKPGTTYTAELVIRALRPNLRHLHVGVSIKDVGNIPAAPIDPANPAVAPILYGVWTNVQGSGVAEPLQGVNVPGWGELVLLATWPWAAASTAAQFVLGGAFLLAMYLYGRSQARKAAGGA